MNTETKGRLLSSNVDYLKELHEEMKGRRVWVLLNKGFYAYVEEVVDEENFLVRDLGGKEWKVSIFHIRGTENNSGYQYGPQD